VDRFRSNSLRKRFLELPNERVDAELFAFGTLLVHAQVRKLGAEGEFQQTASIFMAVEGTLQREIK
jgi:hypothetical protein